MTKPYETLKAACLAISGTACFGDHQNIRDRAYCCFAWDSPEGRALQRALMAIEQEARDGTCAHPPKRLYSWRARDNTLCVGCCDCGAILSGAA